MLIEDRIDVTQRVKTPEGFLVLPATFARTGIQEYTAAQVGATDRDPTERVNVYRPPEEVFLDASLESFARKPVTNDHPPGMSRVTADNAKLLQVGMSGDKVERVADLVKGSLTITDGEAIRQVESGKRQISLGYDCDFIPERGTTKDGEPYEFVQRNIRGNHVAIVLRGRCGPMCSVTDGAECDGQCNHEGGDPMKTQKITIGDSEIEVPESVAKYVSKLTSDMEEAEKKAKDMEEEKAKADEEKEKAEDEKEEAEKAKDKAEAARDAALENSVKAEDVEKLVADHADLLVSARRLVPGLDSKGKGSSDIRREVVKTVCGDEAVKDKSDAYIEARFDALCEGGGEAGRYASRNLRAKDADLENRTASQKAHDSAVETVENAWDRSAKKSAAA